MEGHEGDHDHTGEGGGRMTNEGLSARLKSDFAESPRKPQIARKFDLYIKELGLWLPCDVAPSSASQGRSENITQRIIPREVTFCKWQHPRRNAAALAMALGTSTQKAMLCAVRTVMALEKPSAVWDIGSS